MCARGNSDLRRTAKTLGPEITTSPSRALKLLDLLCAGTLFLLAVAASMLIPKTYIGRVWIYGTDLSLLFAAMLNLLRIQSGPSPRLAKVFSVTANVAMSAFFVVLMVNIGWSQTLLNAQIPAVTAVLLFETAFSWRKHQ